MEFHHSPALILMDIQKGFDILEHWGGNRNNPNAEKICQKILGHWRDNNLPIFHVRHSSQDPNSELHANKPGFAFKDEVKPLESEVVITKNVNSAFIGTNLDELLKSQNIKTVVIIGLTTNHCVSTTARMAGNMGYQTIVISDASATFDRIGIDGQLFNAELIHQTSLASLNNEFAQVIDSNKLLSEIEKFI